MIKSAVKEHGQGNVEFYYGNFFTVTFTRTKKGSSPIQERPLDLPIYKITICRINIISL